MVADMLTLVGIRQFDRRKDGLVKTRTQDTVVGNYKRRIIIKGRSFDKNSDEEFKKTIIYKKLMQIQPKHRAIYVDTIEEYERKRNFIRIYPTKGTNHYDNLFEVTKTNHRIIYKLLYQDELNFAEEELLEYAKTTIASKPPAQSQTFQGSKPGSHVNAGPKILITGDDILIEYVERLASTIRTIKESSLKTSWIKNIESFINHEAWHCDPSKPLGEFYLCQQLIDRVIEMKERRERMTRSPLTHTSSGIEQKNMNDQKQSIIQAFPTNQLEDMLRSSTKNAAYTIVTCLIPLTGPAILSSITSWINTIYKQDRKSVV